MFALRKLPFSNETLVGRIAIGNDFFGVLCKFVVQYRFDGLESAVGHGLKMNSPVAFGQPYHYGFGRLATFKPLWRS